MASLRQTKPTHIAGLEVLESFDLSGPDAEALGFVRSDVVVYRLEGQCRLVVRPSGTEPKLKGYVEVCEPVGPQDSVSAARARALETVETMKSWIQTMLEEA